MPYVNTAIYQTPSDETLVWRYMSLDKFLFLIVKSQLFFCRLDRFPDKWEGIWSKRLFEKYGIGRFPAVIESKKGEQTSRQSINEIIRKSVFVNCWHMNNNESAAMWDLYGRQGAAIAVVSTIGRLKNFLDTQRNYNIGKVYYENHETYEDHDNMYVPFLFKRKSFEHENEVRVFIEDQPEFTKIENKAMAVNVDLARLIQSIYLSPTAPDYLVEVLEKIGNLHVGEEIPFTKSSLYDDVIN